MDGRLRNLTASRMHFGGLWLKSQTTPPRSGRAILTIRDPVPPDPRNRVVRKTPAAPAATSPYPTYRSALYESKPFR
jgi:hypothetical protein